jgi:hypothetical protein
MSGQRYYDHRVVQLDYATYFFMRIPPLGTGNFYFNYAAGRDVGKCGTAEFGNLRKNERGG